MVEAVWVLQPKVLSISCHLMFIIALSLCDTLCKWPNTQCISSSYGVFIKTIALICVAILLFSHPSHLRREKFDCGNVVHRTRKLPGSSTLQWRESFTVSCGCGDNQLGGVMYTVMYNVTVCSTTKVYHVTVAML